MENKVSMKKSGTTPWKNGATGQEEGRGAVPAV